jgi:hypothetical protein
LTPGAHPHEDIFEDYAFDRLSPQEVSSFEEHLLVCEQCQGTLENMDDYIQLMKAATAAYVAERSIVTPPPSGSRDHGLHWNVAAAAVLLLTCLSALLSWRTPTGELKTISLEAYRGDSSSMSKAPSGRPLNLEFDIKDIKPAAGYRVEIVDSTGRRIWFGGTPVHLMKGLPSGSYWVRLFTDNGELLREFGLRAG